MKSIGKILGGLFLTVGFIALFNLLHAQETATPLQSGTVSTVDWSSASDVQVEIQALIDSVPPIPADEATNGNTFWSASHAPGSGSEWPPLPYNPGLNVWQISSNEYLLDDIGYVWGGKRTASTATLGSGGVMAMDDDGGPGVPGGGDGGTNSGGGVLSSFAPVDYGTNLWIAQPSQAAGYYSGILSNTLPDVEYDIQYRYGLLETNWQSAGWFVYGSEATNWTPFSVPMISPTNLFLRALSWQDDGSGLPIWWQEQYFGTNGVDPYGDPAGDGFNNLYKFQNGMNPNVFYTPPAPTGLYAMLDSTGTNALISWNPAQGKVEHYIIERGTYDWDIFDFGNFQQIGEVDGGTTSFEDVGGAIADSDGIPPVYEVLAVYAGGSSPLTGWSYPQAGPPSPPFNANVTAQMVRNETGRWQLMFSAIPTNVAAVQLYIGPYGYEEDELYSAFGFYDDAADFFGPSDLVDTIPVSSITNGIFIIPDSITTSEIGDNQTGRIVGVQPIGASNTNGTMSLAGFLPYDAPCFVDGRQHLKQNLLFELRGATISQNVGLAEHNVWFDPFYTDIGLPSDTNYVESSIFHWGVMFKAYGDSNPSYVEMDDLWPITANYDLHNHLYDTNYAIPGGGGMLDPNTGLPYYGQISTSFVWQTNLVTVPAPPILDIGSPYWISQGLGNLADIAAYTNSGNLYLQSGANNLFGLVFETALVDNEVSQFVTLNPGGSVDLPHVVTFYSQTAAPSLQITSYYFAPVNTPGTALPGDSTPYEPYPLPVLSHFSNTNQTGVLIASVGSPIVIGGWAKEEILNGSSTKFGYLGQYFTTNAFLLDASGNITTNAMGVVSPYGDFFPTKPGAVAMVTMPDIDTGACGTGTVYCVSLNVDANHDGNMDLSFNSADATSQANPMKFWVNNDYDYSGASWNFGNDVQASWYYNDGYQGKIDSQRDLEDYFRLWICGVPALTNAGYQVTLSWANVSSGSPTINLFDTVETNGGIGYLTNLDTATAEAYNYGIWGENRRAIATISPSQPFTFPASYFTNAGDKHFLFDGVGTNGTGELMMTISQNGNTIAQTGVWLEMHDVKDFFEQAVITNNMSGAKSNWTSGVEIVQPAVASALGDDQDLIVLVHGINVRPWDCVNDAETVYKRLYWAGYHGKFAEVEWPCNLLTPIPSPLSPAVFNDSELQGYKASQALTTYLTQLRARFPGYRLHLLVHSQGNSVVSEAIRSGVTFDTYILTQGALPASAYDVNAPVDNDIASYEGSRPTPEWQPMGYRGIYTNFTGRIVNFYNSQDGVLNYWVTDQKLLKPSVYFDTSYYFYNGTNSYFDPPFSANYLVTDPEESRADVSRSRTLPIGQSGPASGHGVIQSAVDLNANFGFNSDISEHSAQWTRPIQTSRPYFQQVLRSCQIIPAP